MLVLLCAATYLPGLFSLPPVDRDESRFAQASRQVAEAIAAGDLERSLVPYVQDTPRLNKPPLIYWLQAASASHADLHTPGRPTHQHIGWYRVPSAVCAILSVLVLWRIGCRIWNGAEGFWAAVMLGSCVMVQWDAHQARADQLLLFTCVLALGAWLGCWSEHVRTGRVGLKRVALLGVVLGLGVLAKGPITPMLVTLGSVALAGASGRWRFLLALQPWTLALIALGMVLPWVLAVGNAVGYSYYFETIYEETIGRSGGAMEGHAGPPGYHLVLLPALFFPGSLFAGMALRRAWRRGLRTRRHGAPQPELALLAWVVPSWLVFEAVATKLPHYPMVLYPALALLVARTVVVATRSRTVVGGGGVLIWTAIGCVLALLGGAILIATRLMTADIASTYLQPFGVIEVGRPVQDSAGLAHWVALVGGTLSLLALLRALRVLRKGRDAQRAVAFASVAACLAGITIIGGVLPRAPSIWTSSAIASQLDLDRPIARTGYHEDSLVFLSRGAAERVSRKRLPEWIAEHPDGQVVIGSAVDRHTPVPIRLRQEWGTVGFNYSNGELVGVGVWSVRRSGQASADRPETDAQPLLP